MPNLRLRLGLAFDGAGERHGNAGQQHGFGAQQAFEFGNAVMGAFKIFSVRPHAHFGAAVFGGAFAGFVQRLDDIAAGKRDAVDSALAFDGYFQAGGERVGNGHAHAVQAAGEGIRALAAFFC